MLIRIIAVTFLIIFIFKLFSFKTIPYLKNIFKNIFEFINYTFKLWIKSSIYTFYLLFKRTTYIIGLDIILTLIFNIILTTISYPYLHIKIWLKLYISNLFNVYVFAFIFFTYIIGLITYLLEKNSIKLDFSKFSFFTKTENSKGTYIYDEETNQYIYHK